MNNRKNGYSFGLIALHWLIAVMVFGLFGLGFWMVDLNYYHTWYQDGPDMHKSFGMLLFALMIVRVLIRCFKGVPKPLATHSSNEIKAAKIVHWLLYLLIFLIVITGYLLSTSDGRSIVAFDLVVIDSLGELFEQQAQWSGILHQYGAYCLIAMVVLHAGAAIKHHIIDKDNTLKRMFGRRP